ncbi:hypothetical protein QVZ43_06230 [Marinobacter sp. chi1]|uniref:Uncharacterized protein n=1 Tax=Marinobacter suaedae TaxID=3057675 RepID=A0ABT8VZ88_9GAMM|nr:hypothetical protein [Marinobacter sp. chi1]MDO3721314.1 hypothetical protein [Marinobacter sp. chi1]
MLSATVRAAEPACGLEVRTELDQLYCDLVARGEGARLPSPVDFRRNDPGVQALLLRRPAQRHGLTVPDAVAELETPEPKPEPNTTAATGSRPVSPVEPPALPGLAPSLSLSDCQLAGDHIRCPESSFLLAENQPNNRLAPGVLGDENRLGLTSFEGNRQDPDAVRQYLSTAYDRYIPAMLSIGLGANTMSFTAFHNAFHTLEDGGVDFAARMEETFRLLKQDKKTLAVKARYHDNLPERLEQCQVINRNIIVCDNVRTNWVYVQEGR